MLSNKKIKKLVVDTGALVKNVPLWEYSEEFFCVPEVIREVKDRQTRQYIDALPIQLQFKEPSPNSIKFINDFTKKSGDYASLSLADVKILALTYELEVESKGSSSHLRLVPMAQRTTQVASKKPPQGGISNPIEGFYLPSNKVQHRNGSSEANLLGLSQSSDTTKEDVENATRHAEHGQLHNSSFPMFGNGTTQAGYDELNTSCFPVLDSHLSSYAFIKGFIVSNYDVFLFSKLQEQFDLLRTLCILSLQHEKGGQLSLLLRTCQNYGLEAKKNSNALADEDTCQSVIVARKFFETYHPFPHFMRWFCHMTTYAEEELDLLSNAVERDLSCCDIFHHMSRFDTTSNNVTTDEVDETAENSEITDEIDETENTESTKEIDEIVLGNFQKLKVTPEVGLKNDCEANDELEVRNQDQISSSSCPMGLSGNDTDEGYDNEGESFSDESEDEDSISDDDEGWITPSNIKAIQIESAALQGMEFSDDIRVACITGDFAMQNTLKHIGLHTIGVDGKLVKSLRTFILRCYACFKTTNKMEKIFCPNCGNKTLKKVSVTLNPDGTQKIWISTKKPINIRGTKYSLPLPKGGKHAINPILVEDQREAQQRVSRLSRTKLNPLHEDYQAMTGVSPFVTRDVYSRSAQLGIKSGKTNHRGIFYWEQKNPNVPLKKGTRRKKR